MDSQVGTNLYGHVKQILSILVRSRGSRRISNFPRLNCSDMSPCFGCVSRWRIQLVPREANHDAAHNTFMPRCQFENWPGRRLVGPLDCGRTRVEFSLHFVRFFAPVVSSHNCLDASNCSCSFLFRSCRRCLQGFSAALSSVMYVLHPLGHCFSGTSNASEEGRCDDGPFDADDGEC